MSFIEIRGDLIRKEDVSGLTKVEAKYPWNGKTHWDVEVHLQGTTVCWRFDSECERNAEFARIANELRKEDEL